MSTKLHRKQGSLFAKRVMLLAELVALCLALAVPPPPATAASRGRSLQGDIPFSSSGAQPPAGKLLGRESPPGDKSSESLSLPERPGVPGLLIVAAAVRDLPSDQAAKALPVALEGVVTALSYYKTSFFFQDATAGISIERSGGLPVKVGDRVQVSGTTGPGMFAPVVLASAVKVVGELPPPAAPHLSYAALAGGAQDSQWIEQTGIVHSARIGDLFGRPVLVLDLRVDGGKVNIQLQDFAGFKSSDLIDATVRIRGVCFTDVNNKRQFVNVGLLVPDRADIDILRRAAKDKFSLPIVPVRDLLQFGHMSHRVKVAGVVTFQVPGRNLYLQDGQDGIRVQSTGTEILPPGSRVEAVGFPVPGEYAPTLQEGVVRSVGTGPPVKPISIQARDVIVDQGGFKRVKYDEELVQLDGTVVESHLQNGTRVWLLQQQGVLFEADLPLLASNRRLAPTAPGSVLRLTGICAVNLDADRYASSFDLLLRSPADVVVLRPGPWWTAGRVLILLAILAAIILVIVLWVGILRHRVQQQTEIIRASEGRFRDLAQRDTLTGLPNRLMLEERIAASLALSDKNGWKAVVFTIDIDRFKHINDTYGHLIGDEILKQVATRLLSRVRREDIIARTGGEEFTIVIGGLESAEDARVISAGLLDLFHDPIKLATQEIKATVSIGAALYPEDGTNSEVLRRHSDQALYEAKKTGRNRAVFVTEAMSASTQLATTIETALREGLRLGQFTLFYQPICDRWGVIRRFEALLRTTDERLAQLGPSEFIHVAEESGLIIPIGRWILEETCRQLAEWQREGMGACVIAVNLSGRQLTRSGFAEEVFQTLERFHIEPGQLELELTETTIMTELGLVAETVAHLADAGFTFAIDDFGTGYSSLSRLCELPIKTLKIDRSFVNNLDKLAGSSTIISAIVQMANSLGLQVVAEGVESQQQFELLRALGCDFFQGYLFAHPMPPDQVMKVVLDNRSNQLLEASLSK